MSPVQGNHNAAATLQAMEERFGGGMAGAIVLHVVVVGIIAVTAAYTTTHRNNWGDSSSAVGAIQASLVNAIPLPPKAPPQEKAVLASDNETPAPAPPPKEKAAPPPKPTDILIKEKPEKPPVKTAKVETPEPPKHPQPTPPTPKAASGDAAPNLPQSVLQLKDGTATVTVQSRTFGNRYAYYLRIVSSKVTQNYYQEDIDARTSMGKSVVVLFDILRDGSVSNLRIENRSGSESLDAAAVHAIQRTDGFGPLPEGDRITIEYKFDYHQR